MVDIISTVIVGIVIGFFLFIGIKMLPSFSIGLLHFQHHSDGGVGLYLDTIHIHHYFIGAMFVIFGAWAFYSMKAPPEWLFYLVGIGIYLFIDDFADFLKFI